MLWGNYAHSPQLLKPKHPKARAPQQEKPLQAEARAPQGSTPPLTATQESPKSNKEQGGQN